MNKKAICGIFGALFVLDPLPAAAGEFVIANSSASEGSPSVVYNANNREYAVAYSRVSSGGTSLYLLRMPRDGVNRDTVIPFFSQGNPVYMHTSFREYFPNVTVSWNDQWGVYLVTWDWVSFTDKDGTEWKTQTYSQRLSIHSPRGTAYTITDGDWILSSHHAYNPVEDDYTLLYCYWAKFDLLSAHLDSSGDDRSNSANKIGKCAMTPTLILNSGWGEYLAVWWYQDAGGIRVNGRRLYRNGLPITQSGRRISFWREPTPLAINMRYSTSPRGAYNPVVNQYLVVWQRGNEVWGRIIEADGSSRVASVKISEGGSPDVIFSVKQNQYIVVYDRDGDIFESLVDPDGNVFGTFQISDVRQDR